MLLDFRLAVSVPYQVADFPVGHARQRLGSPGCQRTDQRFQRTRGDEHR